LDVEDGAEVEPRLEAEVEGPAATPVVEDVEDGGAQRRSSRPLRELPFGHANVPSSTSMEELAIKPTIAASRSAKNKLTASALPTSKRARS
jgi:kinesin family protein 11